MTDKELNIKVAELCRWRRRIDVELLGSDLRWIQQIGDYELEHFECPDYANDLNATHDAEIGLNDKDFLEFHRRLYLATQVDNMWQHNRRFTSATARQRAEAFVKVFEK